MAANPDKGHVFVADQRNHRIDEFNAGGQFIEAWGWDVVVGDGTGFEICVPEEGDVCKAGVLGGGPGQLTRPQGIALDSAGNIYVAEGDFSNRRVQKFDPEGNFVLMFGGDVNKTKVEELGSTEAERNLCTAASGNTCQAATEGIGDGQFGAWVAGSFITIDTNGTETTTDDKVYVGDQDRIQRFDNGGHYVEDLPDPGSVLTGKTVQSLAADPKTGDLFAAFSGKGDVLKLDPTGNNTCTLEVERPTAIAVDRFGQVHVISGRKSEGSLLIPVEIVQFNAGSCKETERFNAEATGLKDSTGIAANVCPGSEAPGNLYLTATELTGSSTGEGLLRAYGTDPVGCFAARTGKASPVAETSATLNGTVNPEGLAVTECTFEYGTTTAPYEHAVPCAESGGEIGTGIEPVEVHADIGPLSKATVYHFRLLATVGGVVETGSDETFKTTGPPVVSGSFTVGATDTEATVRALVNPEGFPTSYHFEFDTAEYSEGEGPHGKSTPQITIGSDRTDHVAIATLEGLTPGTTYHWRIVATNTAAGNPVVDGEDQTVTTYLPFTPETNCPANQAFRTAASAFLPDCRAYEMVSPVNKNGGDIISGLSGAKDPNGYVQATEDGNEITYGAAPSFGNEPNNFIVNQYLAVHEGGEGWSNQGIHPPVTGESTGSIEFGLSREFMAFSPDLCSAWLIDYQTPALTPDGQEGFRNLYRRQNCGAGAGSVEALTPAPPQLPESVPQGYVDNDSVQGISGDARHVVLVAKAAFTTDAAPEPPAENTQIYDRFGDGLQLVSVLPGLSKGSADKTDTGVGSGSVYNRDNAVSSDGSRVYWTSGLTTGLGTGKLYLREHPEQGIVEEECSEPAKACTLPVSKTSSAFFWDAARDGSKALYSEGEDLFEFDLASADSHLIAHEVKGVAGASDDLSRVYLVSSGDLTPGEENEEGEEAQAGQPNLYLEEGGEFTFVGTLAEGDVGVREPGANATAYNEAGKNPYERATRVSPDGSHIAFESRAQLTGFDNTDAKSGKADVEVFNYEAGGGLECVSCNPSGARPGGKELPQPYEHPWNLGRVPTKVSAAAWIPTWQQKLNASNVLSDNGERLFFNSNDALIPRDTNGAQDVYEWEAAGEGSCTNASPSFHAANGGCLYLISSGENSYESEFWEATPDGQSVFFTTESSLLPQDPGLVDLYVARVGGGIPQPEVRAQCEGEACQSPPPPPSFGTPSSSAFQGPPNPKPTNKHKKKHHKKHKHHKKKARANNKRRAAR